MGSIHIQSKNTTFIHIPRTGGTCIRNWLSKFTDANIMPLSDSEINIKHPDYNTTKEYFGDLGWTFCVVRNPYDRLVSMWYYLKNDVPSFPKDYGFKKFVFEYADYTGQAKPMSTWFEDNQMDYIIRFEYLQHGFKVIQQRFKSFHNLTIKNKTIHKPYNEYYDDDTRKFVTKQYKDDLKRFNYYFN